MHQRRARRETGSLERSPICQFFRFKGVGLLKIFEGLLIILPCFGVGTLFVKRLGGIMTLSDNREPQAEQQKNKQSRTDQASHPHQTVLIKISLGFGQDLSRQNPSYIQSRRTQPPEKP